MVFYYNNGNPKTGLNSGPYDFEATALTSKPSPGLYDRLSLTVSSAKFIHVTQKPSLSASFPQLLAATRLLPLNSIHLYYPERSFCWVAIQTPYLQIRAYCP